MLFWVLAGLSVMGVLEIVRVVYLLFPALALAATLWVKDRYSSRSAAGRGPPARDDPILEYHEEVGIID